MARTQSFNRDEAVRAARSIFWAEGYENTSIPELEKATGLSRSSIYNTFGSKRGLFDAAIQSYLNEVIRPRLQPLKTANVAPDALSNYLIGLRTAFKNHDSTPANNGCLLINAAGAPIANDEKVAEVIANYRAELCSALTQGISAHKPSLADAEVSRLGEIVTSLVVTAFALARIDPKQAVHSLDTALDLCD